MSDKTHIDEWLDQWEPMTSEDVTQHLAERERQIDAIIRLVGDVPVPGKMAVSTLFDRTRDALTKYRTALLTLKSAISSEKYCKYSPPRIKRKKANGS